MIDVVYIDEDDGIYLTCADFADDSKMGIFGIPSARVPAFKKMCEMMGMQEVREEKNELLPGIMQIYFTKPHQ